MAETMSDVQVAYPEELSIFEKPTQNLGTKAARCITYYPVNDFSTQGVIQFRVPNNSSSYLDLRKTRLNISCKIVKKNGQALEQISKTNSRTKRTPETSISGSSEKKEDEEPTASTTITTTGDICAAVNNVMHSMFSRVDVALQDKILTNSDDCYPYEAYIKTLLMTSKEEKQSLQSQGFFEDLENTTLDYNWTLFDKGSLYIRGKLFEESKEVDFSGQLCSSVMDISKLIPNGVPLSITLHPSKSTFSLLSPSLGDVNYHIVITKATLSVCTVDIAPEIAIAHSEIMEKSPALFPYNKTEVKKFTLASGTFSACINDPFQSRIPSQLIMGIVKDSAQNGAYTDNPFAFEHAKLNFLGVTVNGQPMGNDPLQPKYGEKPEDGNYVEAYQTLNGVNGNDSANPISRIQYPSGFVLYRFHEEIHSDDSLLPKKSGNMSISLRFDEALQQGMCLIIHATFPGGIKVDKSRAIFEM